MKNPSFETETLENPPPDTVYKSWTGAYRASAKLNNQNADRGTGVRIEKAAFGYGYVIRSTPVFLEMALLKFGMRMPGEFFSAFDPIRSGFGEKIYEAE